MTDNPPRTGEPDDYNEDVISQLAAIREGGWCNMHNRPCVKDKAEQIGFEELVTFIEEESSGAYMRHLREMGRREVS